MITEEQRKQIKICVDNIRDDMKDYEMEEGAYLYFLVHHGLDYKEAKEIIDDIHIVWKSRVT